MIAQEVHESAGSTDHQAQRPTLVGVGHSYKRSAVEAGGEAARAALASLDGRAPVAVIVFANPGYNTTALLGAIREVVGHGAVLAGCQSEGVIYQGGCTEKVCVVNVMAIASDAMDVSAFNVPGYSKDPKGCGAEIARRVGELGPDKARAVLLFPDGVTGNATGMLRALDDGLAFPVQIAGGAAGDILKVDSRNFVTHQFLGSEVMTDSISVMVLGGGISVDITVSHGCTPLGLSRKVTSAEGGWVHEIDGRPAWSVLKEYLDNDPVDLISADIVHLCIGEPLAPELRAMAGDVFGSDYLIRAPLVLSADKRSLFFPGGLQRGNTIQFTRRDPALVSANAARAAGELAGRRAGVRPAGVLQFDCSGRGRPLFGEQVAENAVCPLQAAFPAGTPWSGFFTFGEIAQFSGQSYYHNYTVVLVALYDR